MTCIVVVSNCCNKLKSLYLTKYPYLKSIEIGDDCFSNVDIFKIDGLNELKSLKIGMNSFTCLKSGDRWDWNRVMNRNRSFHILNCAKLESIEIGCCSFSDYSGEFELNNLPKLSAIKIGEIREIEEIEDTDSCSYNFCYSSSFVIKGII